MPPPCRRRHTGFRRRKFMDATTSYPSLARARFAQYLLGTLALLAAMDSGIAALLLEPIRHDLGLTDVEAGLAGTTSYSLAYGLLSVPMGLLADRMPRVKLVFLAMIFWCIALALTASAAGFWTLAAAKTLMGVAAAALLPAALSLLGDYFAPERRA